MKRKNYSLAVLAVLAVIGLSACGDQKEDIPLSGTYSAEFLANEMSYTFEDEDQVTVRFETAGNTLCTAEGTYELSEDGKLISLSFPTAEEEVTEYLPETMKSLDGVFSFESSDERVIIGNVLYQKEG